MPRYQPRHAPRHAAPRRSIGVRAGSALRSPVLVGGAAVIAVGSAVAFATVGQPQSANAAPLALSGALATESVAEARSQAQDSASRASARTSLSTAVAARTAKVQATERAQALAFAQARKAATEHAARETARRKVLENAQTDPKSAAKMLLPEFGFSADQWSCLETLWTGESGWDWRAENASSGAYGIPQSLPGSKMATIANDWRTNPVTQIRWGLKYIKSSYGTPCNALGAWNSRYAHWY